MGHGVRLARYQQIFSISEMLLATMGFATHPAWERPDGRVIVCQIISSKPYVDEVLKESHDIHYIPQAKLPDRYYWINCVYDIKKFCNTR